MTHIDVLMLIFNWSAVQTSQNTGGQTQRQNFALLLVCLFFWLWECVHSGAIAHWLMTFPLWRVDSGWNSEERRWPFPGILCLSLQSSQRQVDQQADRMLKAVILVPLLVLGLTWSLQGLPVLQDPLYPTQENFDLARVSGWVLQSRLLFSILYMY